MTRSLISAARAGLGYQVRFTFDQEGQRDCRGGAVDGDVLDRAGFVPAEDTQRSPSLATDHDILLHRVTAGRRPAFTDDVQPHRVGEDHRSIDDEGKLAEDLRDVATAHHEIGESPGDLVDPLERLDVRGDLCAVALLTGDVDEDTG